MPAAHCATVDAVASVSSAASVLASGLDPDIGPEYALLQVNRLAAARWLLASEVNDLVKAHIQGRILGFIGEERVNVLELNLALAALPIRTTTGRG